MFKKILCATDGSANAGRALQVAGTLAADAGTTIDLVHVIEYFPAGRAAGLTVRVDESEVRARIEEQVAEADVTCTIHMPRGAVGNSARQIADLAEELGSDIIVIGTRGHSAIAGVLLGSVTQRLLHEASIPVLAVPPIRRSASDAEETHAAAVTD